ncbi:MAG: hypothetical protein ACREJG_01425 [Candidatus Rokuibacteriota bacterium]
MSPLHVANGDMAADRLREAAVGGEIVTFIDALHEGPAPAGLSADDWWACRARFVADAGWDAFEVAWTRLRGADARLAAAGACDEVVLWFEHDLNCQLQLVRVLDLLLRHAPETPVTIVCIGEYPGIPDFHGLGQLTGAQMAGLHQTRQSLPRAAAEVAGAAWAAFRSPDPSALEAVIAADTSALPFLGAALRRHLEQFPAAGTGLSRTERQMLEVVASGIGERTRVFKEAEGREASPFMGDVIFFDHLARLAGGAAPLLAVEDGERVALTEHGRHVLAGRADRVALAGFDRWLGGAHLRHGRAMWRRDGERLRGTPRW